MAKEGELKVGMMINKPTGDYYFYGKIVSVFKKQSGAERVVAENKDGILHIFSPGQLQHVE